MHLRRTAAAWLTAALVAGPSPGAVAAQGTTPASPPATTPIQHVVVIFQENVSFDHYFATYPIATNPAGEPAFTGAPGTPSVNGLTPALLQHNPNAAQPFRLDRSQPITCDMNHGYTAEQQAFDGGLMDKFVQSTGAHSGTCNPSQVMGYYDGNTVTALWNYAQHFAMNDNSFGTTFGPSSPGALNLVAGQTHGATPTNLAHKIVNGTLITDLDPTYDDCSSTKGQTVAMSGKNIGDLLNGASLTWGWFEGGFAPTATVNGKAVCGASSTNVAGAKVTDYIPHHEPFQYYASTANPHHLPPTSVAMIGHPDQANHQYDLTDFWAAANAGNLPAVSYLKAPAYQDGHPGYSDPIDEQTFLVNTINRLEQLPTWSSTAVIINYDDSDGWYDHVMSPILSPSNDPGNDVACGQTPAGAYSDRCGYGPRLPMMVVSPYAKVNYVDNTLTDQSSVVRFIEDNWDLGRLGNQSTDALAGPMNNMFNFSGGGSVAPLILDPQTGEPAATFATSAGPSTINTVLASGTWAAYRFNFQSGGSPVTLSLAFSPADPFSGSGIAMTVYSPSNPAPKGPSIGSGTPTGKAGQLAYQLTSGPSGSYEVVVHNWDPRHRAIGINLSTSAASGSAPGLTLFSTGN
jgi:phospholipase C